MITCRCARRHGKRWEVRWEMMKHVDLPLIDSPFGEPVPSIHLPDAPLGLVVAQVRFPAILALDIDRGRELVAAFQERIRDSYPLVEERREVSIDLVEPGLGPKTTVGQLFRFSSADHAWQVSLTRSFIALQATTYTDRADFLDRLGDILDALASIIKPAVCERLGVRYSSRLADPVLLARLPELIRPEILGAAVVFDAGNDSVRRIHMITDSMYALPEASLRARWGIIPTGTTIDADIPPASSESFFIDIDVFSSAVMPIDPTVIVDRARQLCNRQYRYFRWIVTPDYLVVHGGQI
jgi:uncharacterized protein (TIGR04255 family)